MRVTVLPVRDPERPEKPPPIRPLPAYPVPESGFDGMPPTSVELLGARRRAPVPPPRRPVAPEGARPPAPEAVSGPAAPASPAMVEIMLSNGRVVRVPPGFSPAELERVLAIASADEAPRPPAPPRGGAGGPGEGSRGR